MPTLTEARIGYLLLEDSAKITAKGTGDPLASVPPGDVRAWAAAWDAIRADYEARASRWHEARGEGPSSSKAAQLAELGRAMRRAERAMLGADLARAEHRHETLMRPVRERWELGEGIARLEAQLYAARTIRG